MFYELWANWCLNTPAVLWFEILESFADLPELGDSDSADIHVSAQSTSRHRYNSKIYCSLGTSEHSPAARSKPDTETGSGDFPSLWNDQRLFFRLNKIRNQTLGENWSDTIRDRWTQNHISDWVTYQSHVNTSLLIIHVCNNWYWTTDCTAVIN